MDGFIVDRTYRVVNDQAYVYLFGRLENGESFVSKHAFKPYFYIKTADVDAAKGLAAFEADETTLTTMLGDPVTKVTVRTPRDVPPTRDQFEKNKIPCYEADIRFTQRFLMEKGIYASLAIDGEHKPGTHVDRYYEEPVIAPAECVPDLKVLSFDLETSMDGQHLYSAGLAMGDERASLLLGKESASAECFDDEAALLKRFSELVLAWDPDVITGWNVIDFDLADLKRRYDKHKLPFALGRLGWEATLRLESSFVRDSKVEVPGRVVLDGIQLLRSSFISLEDYKLETAAQAFLGEGKLLKGDDRHTEIEDLYDKDVEKLLAYNLKDAELVLRILDAKKLIPLTRLRSQLTGMTMDRVRASIASFDSVYIRHLNGEGKVAPTTRFSDADERITGGYVRESKPGVYDYILVLDFKSMYPSVIRTFNIDPARFKESCGASDIKAPNGACFAKEEGLLPGIIQTLWEERDKAKKAEDQVASLAIKTLMNSFFGVLASPNCRFYSLAMGNAITGFARTFIKLAAEKCEELGYEVIYGDTDSIFVKSGASSKEEAEGVGKKIQDHINEYYRAYVEQEYGRTSFMELEAEKVYRKFLMPTVRGSDVGAKKRYAGLLLKGDDEKLDFTGLEFVRRDWTEVSKRFQLELLDRIFHEREVTGYVKGFVEDVKAGKHDALLVYKKSIRKELDEYVKTTPPHVKAARILKEKTGTVPSTIIEYVVTKNGPEPLGFESAAIDYDHYIDKQIKPIADSVLGFYGTKFDDLLSGSSQQTLFGF